MRSITGRETVKPWFLLKLLLTIAALAVIAHGFSSAALDRLAAAAPVPLVVAAGCILVMLSINAWRWRAILGNIASGISYAASLRLVLIGHFFNQTLPSSVGGDALRAWAAWRQGAAAASALASVLADRAGGVIALTALSLLTLAFSPAIGDPRVLALIALALGGGALGFAGLLLLIRLPAAWLARLRCTALADTARLLLHGLFAWPSSVAILLASLAMASLNCVAVGLVAQSLAIPFPPGAIFLAVPIALLAGAVPVTIGGWGMREGAMVVMLGFYGVAPDAALPISVLFGLLSALCGSPGGVIWLVQGREKPGALAPAVGGEG